MRWAFGLVALLIAAAIVLTMSARQTAHDFDLARRALPSLRDDAAPRGFDEPAARRLVTRLSALLDASPLPADELREAAVTAASWAAATTPGTPPYAAAVALRGAADELLQASDRGDPHRARARQLLDRAGEALTGTTSMPGGPAGGIRDQLQNMQYSQQEKLREVERDAP
ncbi:MAG: hypothetical protein HY825_09100 [Acidobacteria bacterium]|nr:hypothetical protein [Acidobacteriota bacterium]